MYEDLSCRPTKLGLIKECCGVVFEPFLDRKGRGYYLRSMKGRTRGRKLWMQEEENAWEVSSAFGDSGTDGTRGSVPYRSNQEHYLYHWYVPMVQIVLATGMKDEGP